MNQPGRPAADELEICVFSRGSGEAIAIHVGNHRWILIDSLLAESSKPVALEYLAAIGINPSSVDAILLTHWHDDHIKGAALMVDACKSAKVAMPVVLKAGEFEGLLSSIRPATDEEEKFDTGVTELTGVLRLLLKGDRAPQHTWVLANARFMMSRSPQYQFEALSPSSSDVSAFLTSLPAIAQAIGAGGRLPCPNRNDTSVAAVVTVGDEHMLFGADLEVNTALRGWHAVHQVSWMNRGKASFFKIAHHGSKNADYPPVWTDMLAANVYAALTPYNKNNGLPQPEDLSRIAGLTVNAYAVSRARSRSAAKKDSVTNGILRDFGVELVKAPTDLGYVRFRKTIGSIENWTVECFGVGPYRIAA